MSLYPTKTRLALLRDVADGQVCYSTYDGTVLNLAFVPPRRVVAETLQMRQEGWITVDLSAGVLGSHYYELTDAGRAVLIAAGGSDVPEA